VITAKAPGKMILIGEYAVLYGAKSLVCAMDCYASVNVLPSASKQFEIAAPSLSIPITAFNIDSSGQAEFIESVKNDVTHKLGFFKIVFEEINRIIQSRGYQFEPITIEINTDDFFSANGENKYGFGSSAAMTVALIKALLTAVNLQNDYTIDDFFQLAFQIHRKAQGDLGSGIDIAASVYGNVLTYQLSDEKGIPTGHGRPVNRWDGLYVLPIWAGHSTSTRKMVRSVDALKDSSPKIFDKIMMELMHCSENGCSSYIKKDRATFFDCIREFNMILSELGKQSNTPIVSEAHSKLIDLISGTDAVYKPSGAGGGDIGVAFCDSDDEVDNIRQKLKRSEFQILDFSIAKDGMSVHKIDD
jgi:phosphomevalonate kinase